MKPLTFFSAFALTIPLAALHAWGTPTVGPPTADPTHVVVQTPTTVTVTTLIQAPDYIAGSANLQRRQSNGQWTVLGPLQAAGNGVFTFALNVNESASGTLHFRASAAFRGQLKRVLSPELLLPVGVMVQPSLNSQVINGPSGTGLKLTIPPNSATGPILAGIAPALNSDFHAPTGNLLLIKTLDLIVLPIVDGSGGEVTTIARPIQLTLPAPAGTPEGSRYYVAQSIFTGSEQKLLAVDTATAVGGQIVTQGANLEGTYGGGPTVILQETGSGFAEGVASDDFTLPRQGVLLRNSSNDFVFLTDSQGRYKLPISGNSFTVTGIDSTRCSQGSTSNTIDFEGQSKTVNITLGEFSDTPDRFGLPNGGFEEGALPCLFTSSGPLPLAGPLNDGQTAFLDSDGSFVRPLEGQAMATVDPCLYFQEPDPACQTRINNIPFPPNPFKVPSGVTTLFFDFNFVCEKGFSLCPQGLPAPDGDPRLNMSIQAEAVSNNSEVVATFLGSSSTPTLPGSQWREGSLNVTSLAGTSTLVHLNILGSINGDNTNASTVLIDNFRFGTVFVDVKIVEGAMDDLPDEPARFERVRQMVRDANDILAQAGLNVRIRNIQTIPNVAENSASDQNCDAFFDPARRPANNMGHLDLFIPNGTTVSSEAIALLGRNRSTVATDVNVYYVKHLVQVSSCNLNTTFGWAVGPDDYNLADPPNQRGIIIRNMANLMDLTNPAQPLSDVQKANRNREIVAHELGHLLVAGVKAGDTLEHSAPSGNIMTNNRCTPPPPLPNPLLPLPTCSSREMIDSVQSQIINQNGSGLIVP